MSTSEIYAVWPYLRDNARGDTQYAAECFDKARTYTPPSKGHVKKLLKLRPKITVAPKPKPPCPKMVQQRREVNQVMAIGRATISMLKKEEYRNA
jgi:hypothetical protein